MLIGKSFSEFSHLLFFSLFCCDIISDDLNCRLKMPRSNDKIVHRHVVMADAKGFMCSMCFITTLNWTCFLMTACQATWPFRKGFLGIDSALLLCVLLNVEDSSFLFTIVGFMLSYTYHAAPKEKTKKTCLLATWYYVWAKSKIEMNSTLKSPMEFLSKWNIACNTDIEMFFVCQEDNTANRQQQAKPKSCRQDSLLQQMMDFNYHQAVRDCFV